MAYRSNSNTTAGTGTNTTGTEPTGAAENDILIAAMYVEADVAVTAPASWNTITTLDHPDTDLDLIIYYIRRSGSAPSYVWTHSSAYRQLSITAFSGRYTTGDPQDATATTNTNWDTSAIGSSISPANANADLYLAIGKYAAGTTSGNITGMTEQLDTTQLSVFTQALSSSGATGTRTSTISNDTQWATVMVVLREAAAGGQPAISRYAYVQYVQQHVSRRVFNLVR